MGDFISPESLEAAALPRMKRIAAELKRRHPRLTHAWYADDGCASGSVAELRAYLDSVRELGPKYGYILGDKCKLVAPSAALGLAKGIFADSSVEVTTGALSWRLSRFTR